MLFTVSKVPVESPSSHIWKVRVSPKQLTVESGAGQTPPRASGRPRGWWGQQSCLLEPGPLFSVWPQGQSGSIQGKAFPGGRRLFPCRPVQRPRCHPRPWPGRRTWMSPAQPQVRMVAQLLHQLLLCRLLQDIPVASGRRCPGRTGGRGPGHLQKDDKQTQGHPRTSRAGAPGVTRLLQKGARQGLGTQGCGSASGPSTRCSQKPRHLCARPEARDMASAV